jgi:hypothetical protein
MVQKDRVMPSQLNHVLRNVSQFSHLAADSTFCRLCLDKKPLKCRTKMRKSEPAQYESEIIPQLCSLLKLENHNQTHHPREMKSQVSPPSYAMLSQF